MYCHIADSRFVRHDFKHQCENLILAFCPITLPFFLYCGAGAEYDFISSLICCDQIRDEIPNNVAYTRN
jgi:hypothetical protein